MDADALTTNCDTTNCNTINCDTTNCLQSRKTWLISPCHQVHHHGGMPEERSRNEGCDASGVGPINHGTVH
jgi:hypothetical protein